jgi:hypothetical protein
MSWLFSRALVVASSGENSSDGEPCAQLSVICTPHPFWHRDKTTDFSRLSQFGLTFAPLTESRGGELLTWFREDFLARTSPPQEKAPASKEAEADCGERWHGLSVKFDPASCGWKTAHCLFQEDLDWSSLTLPKWGMMQDGELWERTTPGLPTAANESGSGENWPTPLSTDATKGGPNQRDSSGRLGLTARAIAHGGTKTRQTWQTPTVEDASRQGSAEDFRKYQEEGQTSGCRLRNQVKMWPTPRAGKTSDENEESWRARNAAGQVATPPLTLAVKMWPTPKAQEPGMSAKTTGRGVEKSTHLGTRVAVSEGMIDQKTGKLWATPQARDFRSGEGHRFENPERTKNLNDQAAQTEGGGQLNPDWVEWLMGWPIGWTACEPLETGRFRRWCDLHGNP